MSILNQKLESLNQFIDLLYETIDIAHDCRMLLFPASVRSQFSMAFKENYETKIEKSTLEKARIKERIDVFGKEEGYSGPKFKLAGLTGPDLTYKLAEISESANKFYTDGGVTNFSNLLKKALILLKSLIGAIPAIGSALQELIDFIEQRVKDLIGTP